MWTYTHVEYGPFAHVADRPPLVGDQADGINVAFAAVLTIEQRNCQRKIV